MDAEAVARAFHEAYERLAIEHGYQTREASAVAWDDVPEQNKALMIATVRDALTPFVEDAALDAQRAEYARFVDAMNAINPANKSGGLVKVEALIAIGEAEPTGKPDTVTGERDRIRAVWQEYLTIATNAYERSTGVEKVEWRGARNAFAKMLEAIDD